MVVQDKEFAQEEDRGYYRPHPICKEMYVVQTKVEVLQEQIGTQVNNINDQMEKVVQELQNHGANMAAQEQISISLGHQLDGFSTKVEALTQKVAQQNGIIPRTEKKVDELKTQIEASVKSLWDALEPVQKKVYMLMSLLTIFNVVVSVLWGGYEIYRAITGK